MDKPKYTKEDRPEEPVYETVELEVDLKVKVMLPEIETNWSLTNRALMAVAMICEDGSIKNTPVDGPDKPEAIRVVEYSRIKVVRPDYE